MSKTLTDTQLLALSAAAQRDDRCLAPPPKTKGGALKVLAATVIGAGLAREIRAKETSPIWRTDAATGRTYTLKLTTKGEGAIAKTEPEASSSPKIAAKRPDALATAKAGKRPRPSSRAAAGADAKDSEADNSDARSEPRANSKLALLLGLLSRDRGATIAELMAATGWLPHTTRAALTRLRQRGFSLERRKGAAGCASTFRTVPDDRCAQGSAQ
jgi:DNA-binding MarR family transcriptional regulator